MRDWVRTVRVVALALVALSYVAIAHHLPFVAWPLLGLGAGGLGYTMGWRDASDQGGAA